MSTVEQKGKSSAVHDAALAETAVLEAPRTETSTQDSALFSAAIDSVRLEETIFGGMAKPGEIRLLADSQNSSNIAKAIANGGNLDDLLEETAAGMEGGSDGSHSF